MAICPRCNKEYFDYPALSRKDNQTEICPKCGIAEALEEIEKLESDMGEMSDYITDLEEEECENLSEHNRLLVERIKEL